MISLKVKHRKFWGVIAIAAACVVSAVSYGLGKLHSRPSVTLSLYVGGPSTVRLKDASRIEATVRNDDDTTAILIMPGDGSVDAWRTPVVGWSVLPISRGSSSHTSIPTKPQFRQCGMMSDLEQKDVFELRSGESKNVDSGPPFPGPGTYRLVYSYRNQPGLWVPCELTPLQRLFALFDRSWTATCGSPAMQRMYSSTPCELTSNELIVTVVK